MTWKGWQKWTPTPKQRKTRARPVFNPDHQSAGEARLALHLRGLNFPKPEREYYFSEEREWRLDFAWPRYLFAVEVHGGMEYGKSRHSRGDGFAEDRRKFNAARAAGWVVLEFTTQQVNSGEAIAEIERQFKATTCGL